MPGIRHYQYPILPAGRLNLITGKSTNFDVAGDNAKYGGALFLMKAPFDGKFRVIYGAGKYTSYKSFEIGKKPPCCHDQTRAYIMTGEVIDSGDATLETMLRFFQIMNPNGTNKKSPSFAVFK